MERKLSKYYPMQNRQVQIGKENKDVEVRLYYENALISIMVSWNWVSRWSLKNCWTL